MASTIQLRVDDDLKTKSDNLFHDLGTDTTTAIRMFLTKAVSMNGFPFEVKKTTTDPYVTLSENEILRKLEVSRTHADEGRFKDADEVVKGLRNKYGL
ncbi:MAG: type II toxin-antitoxin system RelB/DinJ family antitoxin [Lachnospiraceae bacterium]|nr:type II toxin-antitoxin system RelB/DinJ family antitoxin [Lachnospiraceae bacterium]